MTGSANRQTFLVTVANTTATDIMAAIRTLLSLTNVSWRVSKVLVKEAATGATEFRLARTAANATAANPADGVAAEGYSFHNIGETAWYEDLGTDVPPLFLYHAGGASRTFCVEVWR